MLSLLRVPGPLCWRDAYPNCFGCFSIYERPSIAGLTWRNRKYWALNTSDSASINEVTALLAPPYKLPPRLGQQSLS